MHDVVASGRSILVLADQLNSAPTELDFTAILYLKLNLGWAILRDHDLHGPATFLTAERTVYIHW